MFCWSDSLILMLFMLEMLSGSSRFSIYSAPTILPSSWMVKDWLKFDLSSFPFSSLFGSSDYIDYETGPFLFLGWDWLYSLVVFDFWYFNCGGICCYESESFSLFDKPSSISLSMLLGLMNLRFVIGLPYFFLICWVGTVFGRVYYYY